MNCPYWTVIPSRARFLPFSVTEVPPPHLQDPSTALIAQATVEDLTAKGTLSFQGLTGRAVVALACSSRSVAPAFPWKYGGREVVMANKEQIDWSECPLVEVKPRVQSGAPVLRGRRMPLTRLSITSTMA